MDTSTPVVVAYRGGNGALAAARTLGRLGVPVYLASANGAPMVERSRYWADRFAFDSSAPPHETLDFFMRLADRIGRKAILLPVSDWTALFIEAHADALQERFIFARSRPGTMQALVSKWGMFSAARTHAIPTPETALPRTRDDVLAFIAEATFPVVVKPADPSLASPPAKGIVATPRELLDKFDACAASGDPNVVFQDFIPGGSDRVWMCNAYFDAASRCRAIFTGRKLRQVNDTGIASLAVCERNETVAEQTKRLMESMGYCGLTGIGWKYDERDGRYKLLDVNVRLSGVFRLFRPANGMDVVRTYYCDATGQPFQASAVPDGRKWMLEEDFYAALTLARQKRLGLRDWLRSIAGVRETHWFAFDDPLPGLLWLRKTLVPRVSLLRMRERFHDAGAPLQRRVKQRAVR